LWSSPGVYDVIEELGPYENWDASYRDIRWSGDGRYLSFTLHNEIDGNGQLTDTIAVVDSTTWTRVLTLWDVTNAFVVPTADQGAK
jgi:predicted secreted protein